MCCSILGYAMMFASWWFMLSTIFLCVVLSVDKICGQTIHLYPWLSLSSCTESYFVFNCFSNLVWWQLNPTFDCASHTVSWRRNKWPGVPLITHASKCHDILYVKALVSHNYTAVCYTEIWTWALFSRPIPTYM